MKKIAVFVLSFVMLLALCACGAADTPSSADAPAGATIDFDVSSFDFDLDTYEAVTVSPNSIDLDLSGIDFDFSVEPYEVTARDVTFEFADYQFDFNVQTFDVSQFAEDSSENFSEEVQQEIANMDVEDVVAIAENRANLLADLSHAFKTAGLAVTVDEDRGEIMLDSSVLFAVNEYTISDEGKVFLEKFLAVYTTVVFNPKYEGFISQVLVEGHTDSDGNYDDNMTLSQNRANSVMEFCLSEENGVDEAYTEALMNSLEAIGYSSDKLIYDENGNEDKAASRRVSFRFQIALP